MAWDPCVSCGKTFHGSTVFTYVTWHIGESRSSYRLRQCVECSSGFRNGIVETGDYRDEKGDWRRAADAGLASSVSPLPSRNGAV